MYEEQGFGLSLRRIRRLKLYMQIALLKHVTMVTTYIDSTNRSESEAILAK